MRRIVISIIRAYRAVISPLFPPSCRFEPTCSHYAEEAVRRHGIFWGGIMSAWRILRCNPFSRGGEDPVPETVQVWLKPSKNQ
ncbi:membrane protein insertion efficiency factor YidD [bacterium]|nr:membrane protein insertion efficiency factor YidD [bacterium]